MSLVRNYVMDHNSKRIMNHYTDRLVTPDNVNEIIKGTTELHLACHLGQYWLVVKLMNMGANPLVKDAQGQLPIQLARNYECITYIVYHTNLPHWLPFLIWLKSSSITIKDGTQEDTIGDGTQEDTIKDGTMKITKHPLYTRDILRAILKLSRTIKRPEIPKTKADEFGNHFY